MKIKHFEAIFIFFLNLICLKWSGHTKKIALYRKQFEIRQKFSKNFGRIFAHFGKLNRFCVQVVRKSKVPKSLEHD